MTGRLRLEMQIASSSAKRSEEHTSELQSRLHLVCRLLLEKKNTIKPRTKTKVSTRKKAIMTHTGMRSVNRRPPVPIGPVGDSVSISHHMRCATLVIADART